MQPTSQMLQMLEAMSRAPDPADPVVTITLAGAKELLKLLDDGRPEALDDRLWVNELRAAIDQEQPELWGTWSVGPNEFHPSMSKEDAERDRRETLDTLARIGKDQGKEWPEIAIEVVRSPREPEEHWQTLAENEHQQARAWKSKAQELQAELDALQAKERLASYWRSPSDRPEAEQMVVVLRDAGHVGNGLHPGHRSGRWLEITYYMAPAFVCDMMSTGHVIGWVPVEELNRSRDFSLEAPA